MIILFDTLNILADSAGSAISKEHYISQIMPLILERWTNTPDDDQRLIPLFETMSSLSIAFGAAMLPFAQPVWNRSIHLIKNTFLAIQVISTQIGLFPGSYQRLSREKFFDRFA